MPDTTRAATSDEVKRLAGEICDLKEIVAGQTLEKLSFGPAGDAALKESDREN